MFLLLVLLTSVVLIMVVATVKKKAAHKQKKDGSVNDNPYLTAVVMQRVEVLELELDVDTEYKDA